MNATNITIPKLGMTDSDVSRSIARLSLLISSVVEVQEHCLHNHHCHRYTTLIEAEALAERLASEFSLRESEAFIASSTAAATGHA